MKKKINLCSIIIFSLMIFFFFSNSTTHSKNINEEDQLLKVGIGAYTDGLYDIAEKQFSQFLRDYPNHSKSYDVCYLLGETLLNMGNEREAKKVFLRIINEKKNFEYIDYTLFWVAEIEMKTGYIDEAKRFFLSIINRFPKFEWIDYVYYRLGLLDFLSNKLITAESYFKKVSLLSKNNELIRSSWFWLGFINYKQNNYEAAIGLFKRIWEEHKFIRQRYLNYALFWLGESQLRLGRFNDAKANFKIFYDQFKSDVLTPEAFWRVGFCEYRLGNFNDSILIFQSLKKQLKNSRLISYSYYLLGQIFMYNGDYSLSIKELNPILDQVTENGLRGVSIITLFWNYLNLNDIDGANRVFQKLQKMNYFEDEKTFIQWLNAEMVFIEGKISDSLPYYFNILNTGFREKALFQIGKGYFFENKLREAITNLDILLLEFPNFQHADECLFIKEECLLRLGNLDQALGISDLIIKQGRNNFWELFALMQIGTIYVSRNENEKAKFAFEKIIHNFPNHPLSYHAALQLGNLYFKNENIVEAVSYYSMVLKGNLLESFGEAYFGLGEIFYQQGKYEKAFKSFETAVQYFKEPSLWYFLTQLEIGNLQKKLGRYKEAKGSYQIVLDRSQDEEIKNAAKELLSYIEIN